MKGLPRRATDVDGRLHISQVTVVDSGQYVCTGLDTAAGAQPATVTLIVDDSCTSSSLFISSFDYSLYFTVHVYGLESAAGAQLATVTLIFTARCYASAVLAMALCLSVCPSQVGVLLKQLNVGSQK